MRTSTWSPDGRWIYFTSHRSGGEQIWRMPASGGLAEQVTQQAASNAWISPDGSKLFFSGPYQGQAAVWRMPTEGGAARLLVGGADFYAVGKRGIYFSFGANLQASNKSRFAYFDFASEKVIPLIDLPQETGYVFSVSPDERSLLYTQVDYRTTDLMKIERFR